MDWVQLRILNPVLTCRGTCDIGIQYDREGICRSNEDFSGNEVGQATPPAREFDSVSTGGMHTCGVTRDGSVECWGDDEYDQATPPSGEFDSVSAGSEHTCGVRRHGAVVC